jgi:hypothetical protein
LFLQEVFKNKKRFIALFFKLLLLGSPKYYGAKSLKTGLLSKNGDFVEKYNDTDISL